MRWLSSYLRQVFCAHDWRKEENQTVVMNSDTGKVHQKGSRISLLCMKCGYHRAFWKF